MSDMSGGNALQPRFVFAQKHVLRGHFFCELKRRMKAHVAEQCVRRRLAHILHLLLTRTIFLIIDDRGPPLSDKLPYFGRNYRLRLVWRLTFDVPCDHRLKWYGAQKQGIRGRQMTGNPQDLIPHFEVL